MDGRVEGLDTAAEHLGVLCDIGDVLNGHAGVADGLCGAARAEEANALGDEALGEGEEAGLVVDAEEGDGLLVEGHGGALGGS